MPSVEGATTASHRFRVSLVGDLTAVLAALDVGERVRGRGFERLCKWVLENEPEYAALLERVWLWDEWPDNLGRSDAGIDLVARTREGKLWAIQAKHYGPATADHEGRRELVPARGGPLRVRLPAADHVGQRRQRPPCSRDAGRPGSASGIGSGCCRSIWTGTRSWRGGRRRAVSRSSRVRISGMRWMRWLRAWRARIAASWSWPAAPARRSSPASCTTQLGSPADAGAACRRCRWSSRRSASGSAVGEFDYLAVCSDETVAPTTRRGRRLDHRARRPGHDRPGEIAAFLRKRGARRGSSSRPTSRRRRSRQAQAGRMPAFDLVDRRRGAPLRRPRGRGRSRPSSTPRRSRLASGCS